MSFFSWRQKSGRRHPQADAGEEYSRFLAAAETSLDSFYIFDAVRDESGAITDFRLRFLNLNARHALPLDLSDPIGESILRLLPSHSSPVMFAKYCNVVETAQPLNEERPVSDHSDAPVVWIRSRVVKLGDGFAMTSGDISKARETEERYQQLAEFNDSIFQHAPFSIVATDADGVITAMNKAAENLSGYSREELVGKAPLTLLHDHKELAARSGNRYPTTMMASEGFDVLTSKAANGEMEEQEWTYVRRDGTRRPINLAIRAITNDSGAVSGFVGIAFDVTERREMLNYVTHLATHDQLTGLVGRAVLQDRLVQAVERARRYGTKVAVFMLDLDQFKRINDLLGHRAGDQVLLEAAGRLRRAVRSSDTVARTGGDEFVVVMPDITSVSDVEQCAINLVSRFAPEISVEGQQVYVTASVGVCIYPDFAADSKHLLKRADAALYAAKENGRNQHQVFTEGMLKETVDRLSMEHSLRHALTNKQLSLHYQAQVSLTTGAVVGMEALLRWFHPKFGMMEPAQFMHVAEDTGLIIPIGEWAFLQACREGKAMQDELGMELTVSVNLSPRQFQQKNLLDMVEGALAKSGLAPRHLELEITENTLMINSTANLDKLQKIRDLGVRISIDDFGTGFCSFSYLLQYQVDRLKIDRSFIKSAVTDGNAAAVVRTIIAMSHGLNIEVVAEGVETEEQLRFLMRKRCDAAQGYLLARPVAAHEFCDIVRAGVECPA